MAVCGLELITGVMGSGKSYYGAELVYQALREGAQVHTNIGLNWVTINRLDGIRPLVCEQKDFPKCRYRDHIVELPKDVKLMRSCIRPGSEGFPNVLVLDEASIFFYVDDQNTTDADEKAKNREVFSFLVWVRRYGLEVYFITQDAKNVNVKLRRMCQYMTKCKNNNHVPYFAWLIKPIFGDFKRQKYTFEEDTPVRLLGHTVRFRKEIGEFYHTLDLMGQVTIGDRMVTRKKPKRYDQTIGKVIVAAVLILLLAGVGAVLNFIFGFMDHGKNLMRTAEAQKKATPAGVQALAKKPKVVLLRRSPSYLLVMADGSTYYPGKKEAGRRLVGISEYGKMLLLTWDDKKTTSLMNQ